MTAPSIALQDAARELNIGIKTLKRWLDIAGISRVRIPETGGGVSSAAMTWIN